MELTDKQLEYFAAMESTFDTPGWAIISQGWQAELDSLPERVFWSDPEKFDKTILEGRIRFELLTQLVQLPTSVAASKDEAINMDPQDG